MSNPYIKPILKRKVAMSTTLIHSQYDLEQTEKTIIYLVLASINQKNIFNPTVWHKLNVKDYAFMLGTRTNNNLTPMRLDNAKISINKAIKDLYDSSVKFYNENNLLEEHRWLIAYKELNNSGEIELKLNPELAVYITELKTFTNILTGSLAGIKGKYISRIIELIGQTPGTSGYIDISIAEFVFMLDASETYLEYKYLNRDILKPSFKELLNKNIVKITALPIKEARKVIGFTLNYVKLVDFGTVPDIVEKSSIPGGTNENENRSERTY